MAEQFAAEVIIPHTDTPSKIKEDGPVLLAIVAHWCGHCQKDRPLLNLLAQPALINGSNTDFPTLAWTDIVKTRGDVELMVKNSQIDQMVTSIPTYYYRPNGETKFRQLNESVISDARYNFTEFVNYLTSLNE